MRSFGFRGRMGVVVAMSVGVALCATTVQATAPAVPGTPIAVIPQPDGWRGTPGGAVVDYWTTGSDGSPKPASGAIFIPPGPAPKGGWPILAFDHGSMGLGPGCGGQSDPASGPWADRRVKEDAFLRTFLSKGFALVAPDYLGLGRFDTGVHPYLELKTEAAATVDLVKAARAARTELGRRWIVFGGSQGGQAALGTAYLQQKLAPELDFRGAIALDPESEVENLLPMAGPWGPDLPSVVGDALSAFVVSALAGLRAARPDAKVDSYLTPRGKQVLDSVGRLCLDKIAERVTGVGISDLLAKPLTNAQFHGVLADYLGVPVSGYDAPILLLLNALDLSVPSPLHAALVARFAANRVDHKVVTGLGRHMQMNPEMRKAIDAFLDRARSAS
ncbi:lipase family protein [Nocardia transvalensis]|uniref:lipase family protein n=1 Tax=Nocardia transvalensis TaxID=37333 RepID=UPI0018947B87|nr:lipase family protein [Nocardia transvalensis]MBF6330665.1 alpha/beta fold hydrolase [Nocardia transvalensis]